MSGNSQSSSWSSFQQTIPGESVGKIFTPKSCDECRSDCASCCSILSIKVPRPQTKTVMSLRLLLGILAPGPPDQSDVSETFNYSMESGNINCGNEIIIIPQIEAIQNQAKFHIGMLSISLIIGLAFGGFTAFNWWMEKSNFLSYVRNLVIALVCRTFFSIVFDGAILLGSLTNVEGGNALLAFEQISRNLVLAFWLTLTIYLHARVQRNFKSEPTLNLYKYGVPGVALFFAFIWIFLLQDQCPSLVWWIIFQPLTQWIVNSFNLLCLLIQLGVVGDMSRIMMNTSLDNDAISLFRKITVAMGVLIFIFWLDLGLFIGRIPMKNSSGYAYFFCFIDGLECALVCMVLYFFSKWVGLSSTFPCIINEEASSNASKPHNEELLAGSDGRGIVTIDSVFMTKESGSWKNTEEEEVRDVVYSNVVEPQRLQNILGLYKRLNNIPSKQATVVEGEEFFDCLFQEQRMTEKQIPGSDSDEYRRRISSQDSLKLKYQNVPEQAQKRTAFYSSKYLVLDSKGDIPKYLETHPSLSSRGSWNEDKPRKDYSSDKSATGTDELVRKWLSDNSENMQKPLVKPQPKGPGYVSLNQKKDPNFFPVSWDDFSGKPNYFEEENEISLKLEATKARGEDPEKARETEADGSRPTRLSLNTLISDLMKSMLISPWKETSKEETLTKENVASKQDFIAQTPIKTDVPKKVEHTGMKESQETFRVTEPALREKDNETYRSNKEQILPSQDLLLQQEVHPREKERTREKISTETVDEAEKTVPKEDFEAPKAKEGQLNVYVTYSELQEYRLQREAIERRVEKSDSFQKSYLDKINSILSSLFSKTDGSLGTEISLQKPENVGRNNLNRVENEVPLERSNKSEMKIGREFEISERLEIVKPIEQNGKETKKETELEEYMSKRREVVGEVQWELGKREEKTAEGFDEMNKSLAFVGLVELSGVKEMNGETQVEEMTKPPKIVVPPGPQSGIKEMKSVTQLEEIKPLEIVVPIDLKSGMKDMKTETELEKEMTKPLEIVVPSESQSAMKDMKPETQAREEMTKALETVDRPELQSGMKELKTETQIQEEKTKPLKIVVPSELQTEKTKTDSEHKEPINKRLKIADSLELDVKEKEPEEERKKLSITSFALPSRILPKNGRLRSGTDSTSSDSEFSIEKDTKGMLPPSIFIPPPVLLTDDTSQTDADAPLKPERGTKDRDSSSSSNSGSTFSLEGYYQSVSSAKIKMVQSKTEKEKPKNQVYNKSRRSRRKKK